MKGNIMSAEAILMIFIAILLDSIVPITWLISIFYSFGSIDVVGIVVNCVGFVIFGGNELIDYAAAKIQSKKGGDDTEANAPTKPKILSQEKQDAAKQTAAPTPANESRKSTPSSPTTPSKQPSGPNKSGGTGGTIGAITGIGKQVFSGDFKGAFASVTGSVVSVGVAELIPYSEVLPWWTFYVIKKYWSSK